MNACVHLWYYIAESFLEWEMFHTKVVEKVKTHILCSITPPPLPRESCRFWDNVEKYGTAVRTTVDNVIRRMLFACWVTKATNTHSEYVLWGMCSSCFELRGGLYISVRIIHFVLNVHHTDAGCLSGYHYHNFRVFSVLCNRHASYFVCVSLLSAVGHFVISERLFSAVICTLWLKRLCSEYFRCFWFSLCAVWG